MPPRSFADSAAGPCLPGKWLPAVVANFDPGQKSALADFVNAGMSGQFAQQAGHGENFRLKVFQNILVAENVETRQGRGTTQGVAGVAMAVIKCLLLLEFAKKCGKDPFGRQRGREWQIPAGESLGEAEKIRDHIFLFARKHRSRAAESGQHFVKNQERANLIALRTQASQKSLRPDTHPGGSLDERFDDNRSNLLRRQRIDFLGIRNPINRKMVCGKALVKCPDPAEACSSSRVAMVGLIKSDKASAFRESAQLPILDGHFHRGLHGRRTIVTEKDPGKCLRRKKP